MYWISDVKIVNNPEKLKNIILNENYAALVTRIETMLIYQQNSIKCFNKTQTFSTFPIAFFVRKDFKIIDSFNKIIRHAFEAGLIQLWFNRLSNEKFTKHDDNSINPIKLNHLTFLIGFVVVVEFLSVILFFAEIIIFKMAHSTQTNSIWLFFNWLIDGERHLYFFNDK